MENSLESNDLDSHSVPLYLYLQAQMGGLQDLSTHPTSMIATSLSVGPSSTRPGRVTFTPGLHSAELPSQIHGSEHVLPLQFTPHMISRGSSSSTMIPSMALPYPNMQPSSEPSLLSWLSWRISCP